MFKFLKKFFKEEQEIIEQIAEDELHDWFHKKATAADRHIKEKVDTVKEEMRGKIEECRKTLKTLETATLRNPNISVREKQFMEGNRKSYLHRTDHFLKEIEDLLELEVGFFISHYDDYVHNFSMATTRSYQILQEFLANETREIAMKIRDMDSTVEKLKSDEKIHRHNQLDIIKKELESIKHSILKKDEIQGMLKEMHDQHSKLHEKEKELSDKKEQITSSKEHKEIINHESKKQTVEQELKKLSEELYSAFSILQRPLKKYQRIAYKHDKLVEHYHMDALNTLVKDINLHILEILEGMIKNMDKLALKDKISSKVHSQIKSLNKDYFQSFLDKYNSMIKEKDDLEKKIKQSQVKKELEETLEQLENLKIKKHSYKTRIDTLKGELNNIDIKHLRDKVKKKIEEAMQIKIEYR